MQGLDLSGIASGMGAGAQVASGFAGYQAQRANAAYADANAQSALIDGAAQSSASNAQYRAAIGEQLAAQGASGFEMGTGSALDALNQSRINEAQAAMQINRTAGIRASIYSAQAEMDRKSATSALIGGILKGASSVIGGGMDYANSNAAAGFGGASNPAGALQPSMTSAPINPMAF